jgi:hypothetical protein
MWLPQLIFIINVSLHRVMHVWNLEGLQSYLNNANTIIPQIKIWLPATQHWGGGGLNPLIPDDNVYISVATV